MFLLSSSNKQKNGFTVVELIVSIGIMLAITSVIVFNQSQYSSSASLQNLANELSLSLRQAQVYGISVKEISPGSNNFNAAYGMTFSSTASTNNSYIFFADKVTPNKVYDNSWDCPLGASSECLEKTMITHGNTVSALCVIPSTGGEDCSLGRVDITFLRPATEARIVYFNSAHSLLSFPTAKGVRIKLASPQNENRSVVVYTTGQISVQ